MPRRTPKPLSGRAFTRALKAMTWMTTGAGARAPAKTLRSAPASRAGAAARGKRLSLAGWRAGVALGATGVRRYKLYQPPGVKRGERLPLLVMLHGCGQGAEALAACSQMNWVAARERFLVLYPEQDPLANMHGCWNWYETASGRAQSEAASIMAAVDQVCRGSAADAQRIALAGLSAGAGMAALLATRYPQRFRAIAMHSGIAPGVAYSTASALNAMSGRRIAPLPFADFSASVALPALLVIHGSADTVVAPSNGAEAVRRWAACGGALAGAPRTVQRGARYAATITDYRRDGAVVATLCAVEGLGHAWSGGAAGLAYSDAKGPDASRMIWAFVARQLAGEDKPRHPRLRLPAARALRAAC